MVYHKDNLTCLHFPKFNAVIAVGTPLDDKEMRCVDTLIRFKERENVHCVTMTICENGCLEEKIDFRKREIGGIS